MISFLQPWGDFFIFVFQPLKSGRFTADINISEEQRKTKGAKEDEGNPGERLCSECYDARQESYEAQDEHVRHYGDPRDF
jgi:hypothetical protein